VPPEQVDGNEEQARRLAAKLAGDAAGGGYYLNPDADFTLDLARGLAVNQRRYGYPACPCRIADGVREKDLDIICPCNYRDQDIAEYDACYCGLYVSRAAAQGRAPVRSIPERRPAERAAAKPAPAAGGVRVWRCKVCGYLCARPGPPDVCPVCKVPKDRFEQFHLTDKEGV